MDIWQVAENLVSNDEFAAAAGIVNRDALVEMIAKSLDEAMEFAVERERNCAAKGIGMVGGWS